MTTSIITNPIYGEVSDRVANNVIADPQLRYSLREAYNILISRNLEIMNRPPTYDMGPIDDTGGSVTRSFQFRLPDGNFTNLTFSNLRLAQSVVGTEATFTPITTTWTEADIELMDGCNNENNMIFTTPAKEPIILQYDPVLTTFALTTVQLAKAGADDPPWHLLQDWPYSVTYMIGRFIFISPRRFYGSKAGDDLDWDLTTTTEFGDLVVTPSSAFAYNAKDDLDSGFHWIRGGDLAMAGSPAGTWMMSNLEQPLNTQVPNIKNYSSIGTSKVPGVAITGGFLYFCNDNVTMKLFAVDPNGFQNPVMNEYSKHFFEESPPKRMVFQRTPDTILWILREDGQVIMFTIDEKRRAWSKFKTDGIVKDIWLGKDNNTEYLYMDVDRGNDRRMERIEEIDSNTLVNIADDMTFHSEAAEIALTAMTTGTYGEGVYTSTGHGYTGGELVRIIGIDDNYGYIVFVDANTFSLEREDKTLIEATFGYDFTVRDAIREYTVAHYANSTMDVYLDGYYNQVDADGTGKLLFDVPASDIIIGYPFDCYVQPRSFVDLLSQHRGTVDKVHPRVYKTKNLIYGRHSDNLDEKHIIPPGEDSYTGIVSDLAISGGVDFECTFYIGGRRTPFIMSSCIIEIDIGAN